MLERVMTGVAGLDKLLQGGLPKGSTTTVIGPPGSGKTVFALQFLVAASLFDRKSVYMFSFQPSMLKPTIQGFGWDPEVVERMFMVDLFSEMVGRRSTHKYTASPFQLTSINITLNKLLEENNFSPKDNARLVLDSLSDVITFNKDLAKLNVFLQSFKEKLWSRGVTSLLTLTQGVHEPEVVNLVESISDGVVLLRQEATKRYIAVKKMMATPIRTYWAPFKISSGIELKTKTFLF